MQDKKARSIIWICRLLVGIVTFINLMAAFEFMLQPEVYAPTFELSGESGAAIIQGVGLLFLMWNIPYLFALYHPMKHFVSLIESVIMQAIGVIGESVLLLVLPGEHPQIQASVERFIIFDGGGLVLLIITLICIQQIRKHSG